MATTGGFSVTLRPIAFVGNSVVIGDETTSNGSSLVVLIGTSSHIGTTSSGSVVVGENANVSDNSGSSVALGISANIDTSINGIAIGNTASLGAGSASSLVVGSNSSVSSGLSTLVGSNATIAINSDHSVAIGQSASITGLGCTVVGDGASATAANSQAYGRAASAVTNNTVVFGAASVPILDFHVKTNIGANLKLFSFESALAAANNDTSMTVLYKNDSGTVVNAHVTVNSSTGALSVPVAHPANKVVYSKTFKLSYTDFSSLGGASGFVDIHLPFPLTATLLVSAAAKVGDFQAFTGAGITTATLKVGSSGSSGLEALISSFSVATEAHVENNGTDNLGADISYPDVRVTLTVDSALNLLTNGDVAIVVTYTLP